MDMRRFTMTWRADSIVRSNVLRRWTIFSLDTFVRFLSPSARAPFTFFGSNPCCFRVSYDGKLLARSATYQGV